jgi:hypothetical protein
MLHKADDIATHTTATTDEDLLANVDCESVGSTAYGAWPTLIDPTLERDIAPGDLVLDPNCLDPIDKAGRDHGASSLRKKRAGCGAEAATFPRFSSRWRRTSGAVMPRLGHQQRATRTAVFSTKCTRRDCGKAIIIADGGLETQDVARLRPALNSGQS